METTTDPMMPFLLYACPLCNSDHGEDFNERKCDQCKITGCFLCIYFYGIEAFPFRPRHGPYCSKCACIHILRGESCTFLIPPTPRCGRSFCSAVLRSQDNLRTCYSCRKLGCDTCTRPRPVGRFDVQTHGLAAAHTCYICSHCCEMMLPVIAIAGDVWS